MRFRINALLFFGFLLSLCAFMGYLELFGVQSADAHKYSLNDQQSLSVSVGDYWVLDLHPPVLFPIDNADGDGRYMVTWTEVPSADIYRLQEDDNPDFSTPIILFEGSETQYQVASQYYGTWYYRVQASNTSGDSEWSNTESVIVNQIAPDSPMLEPISNPDGDGDYEINWTLVLSATSYRLKESETSAFITPTVRYEGDANQFLVNGQSLGRWYYRVLASNAAGDSSWSNTQSVNVLLFPHILRVFLPLIELSKPVPSGVYVLANSFNYVSHDTLFIIGEVLNNPTDSLTLVEVTVDFFDADGRLVDTDHTYLWPLDLPAKEKGCFGFSMYAPVNWSYYKFETPTFDISDTSPELAIISDSGSYNPGNGDYEIIGQVQNGGYQRSISVSVSGTLYNTNGSPVGCERAHVSSNDLDPGQISSFDILYLGYYRYHGAVTNYQLRVAGDLPI